MFTFISAGLVLGLSAGISPGPLMTLVISQTLQYGIKDGIKVALAPLITDAPIILLSLFVLTGLADFKPLLGAISLFGGGFILRLAYGSLKIKKLDQPGQSPAPQSLSKGALVNALSPHPYLFWLTVGAPLILKARKEGLIVAVLFVVTFISCLVGAKIVLAVLSGRTRHLLSDRFYRLLMRFLGLLLVLFAFLLIKDGLVLLNLLH